MDEATPPFARKLSAKNLEILWALANASEPNWFRDALDDPEVFFALRNDRVDAYSRGALIYRIDFRAGTAVPHTHVKYLIREPRNERAYIAMRGGAFDDDAPQMRMQTDYRAGHTLKEIKNASTDRRSEGYGVYLAIKGDPFVVDLELSIVRTKAETEDEDNSTGHDRIDIVRLEPNGLGYNLVFWEAKLYGNRDLFTDRVLKQVDRYHGQIERHQPALVKQYRAVCAFQAEILKMRLGRKTPGVVSSFIETMESLATAGSHLGLDVHPRIFAIGFDGEQKGRWKKREKELQEQLGAKNRVRGIGEPYGGYLGR